MFVTSSLCMCDLCSVVFNTLWLAYYCHIGHCCHSYTTYTHLPFHLDKVPFMFTFNEVFSKMAFVLVFHCIIVDCARCGPWNECSTELESHIVSVHFFPLPAPMQEQVHGWASVGEQYPRTMPCDTDNRLNCVLQVKRSRIDNQTEAGHDNNLSNAAALNAR